MKPPAAQAAPRYQLLEGGLEEMQEAINLYAKDGWRLVSLTGLRVSGGGDAAAVNEYCAVLEAA